MDRSPQMVVVPTAALLFERHKAIHLTVGDMDRSRRMVWGRPLRSLARDIAIHLTVGDMDRSLRTVWGRPLRSLARDIAIHLRWGNLSMERQGAERGRSGPR